MKQKYSTKKYEVSEGGLTTCLPPDDYPVEYTKNVPDKDSKKEQK